MIPPRILSPRSIIDSEERFRSLSEASFEGIAIIDGNKIIEANKTLCEMFGYSSPEIIGMTVDTFVASDERERVTCKLVSQNEIPYERIGLKQDGTIFPIEIQSKVFFYKGRQVMVLALCDITGQKEAEKEIETLRGILPICSSCKKIRDDKGYWNQIESYIHTHSGTEFSHGFCPDCFEVEMERIEKMDLTEFK